jgi:hypothetical protein
MKLTHKFAEMTRDKTIYGRPRVRFETMDHGGEYPDTMPSHQAD